MNTNCGCTVDHSIIYCPLHAAAPQMLEALKKINSIRLDPELQIITAEHYQNAWMDCNFIARHAIGSLESEQGVI